MEAPPGAALEMVQAQFLLHLLVTLLHRPATLPQPHGPQPRGLRRQVAEGILQLPVGLTLDQQPDRLGPGARARGPAAAGPDPQPGEGARQPPPWPPAPRPPAPAGLGGP